MKKSAAALLLALCALLPSCGSGETEETQPSVPADTAAAVTVTGTGKLTWHNGDANFLAVVDVTIENDSVKSIELRKSSVVSTDAFTGWRDNRETYLAQYDGLSLDAVKELKVNYPTDITDHNNVGSLEGEIDAISGATASSVVIAAAVKDAVEKYDSK